MRPYFFAAPGQAAIGVEGRRGECGEVRLFRLDVGLQLVEALQFAGKLGPGGLPELINHHLGPRGAAAPAAILTW